MLLDIRDVKICEHKIEFEDGEPVVVDVVPSIKERREACKLILPNKLVTTISNCIQESHRWL